MTTLKIGDKVTFNWDEVFKTRIKWPSPQEYVNICNENGFVYEITSLCSCGCNGAFLLALKTSTPLKGKTFEGKCLKVVNDE